MKHKIFTVYDIKAQLYMPPFYMQSTGLAMRSFEDTVHDPEHAFGKHPEDYILYELGTFDDNTSEINMLKVTITLAKAIELCVKSEPDAFTVDQLRNAKREDPKDILEKKHAVNN